MHCIPSQTGLLRELLPIALHWEDLGILLGIDSDLLNIIASDNLHDSKKKCLCELLQIWLKKYSPPPSWTAIADAVDKLGEFELVQNLRIKYCISSRLRLTM